MKLWLLVPVKSLRAGKSRLSAVLTPQQRSALVQRLLEHTLCLAQQCGCFAGLLVVSRSPGLLATARRLGAAVLRERGPGGLNEAIEAGCAAVGRQGGDGVLVLPADLPDLTVQDLAALAQLLVAGADVVIAPSRDGGTNALGLRLPPAIAPAFGTDSFARHVAQAQAVACRLECYPSPTVAFDLDWPADLGRAGGEWRVAT